jgi:L-arabinose isomerase
MTTSGHNVGLEEEKPMNDTPRTDVAWKTTPSVYDFIVEMKRIERELNAANERISKLYDYVAVLETAGDEMAKELSYGYDVDLWNKARGEAKP